MLDLKAMQAEVDAVLARETPESLRAWLDDYRQRQAALQSYAEKERHILFSTTLHAVLAPSKAVTHDFGFSMGETKTLPSDFRNYSIAA